jgi:LuxR family transcriptional regulator, quorum-sensing system regulator SolR
MLMLRFEEFVQQSQGATTAAELSWYYEAAIAGEGYQNCVFTSVRGHRVGHMAWFDLPQGYHKIYFEQRWDRIDPVLASTIDATRPFFWSDVLDHRKLSKAQVEFMEHCKELKVHSGLVFPFHGPGNRLDVMSISRRIPEPPNPERTAFLHAVSVQAWSRFLELKRERFFLEQQIIQLTPRELEILRWCKDGKNRNEIADILSISMRTVAFHLQNIMDKLGATNQITAVVVAIQHGILDL